jgi:hypothetical protein
MEFVSDSDVWEHIDPDDLWIYDRLILSRKLKYNCGPAGVAPKERKTYIVKPCVNFRMMGHGASLKVLSPTTFEIVPDGYFWCEKFEGRHLSFDYYNGEQILSVEGFKDDPSRLDRFSRWKKVSDTFKLPDFIQAVADKYKWMNVETIGGNIIEIHLRYNDDFRNHKGKEIVPIWKDEFYDSPCGDRIGFIVKE